MDSSINKSVLPDFVSNLEDYDPWLATQLFENEKLHHEQEEAKLKLIEHNNSVSNAKTELNSLTIELSKKYEESAKLTTELGTLTGTLQYYDTKNSEISKQIEEKNSELKEILALVDLATTEWNSLEEQFNSECDKNKQISKEIENLSIQIENMESK